MPETHDVMISENFETWLQTLETTDLPQARDYLAAEIDDGRVGYCCLGIACKIAPDAENYLTLANEYTRHSNAMLMPAPVVKWLGLTSYWPERNAPVDWDVVSARGTNFDIELAFPFESKDGHGRLSASGMNDNGFTFKQIAQTIRYFGIDRITT